MLCYCFIEFLLQPNKVGAVNISILHLMKVRQRIGLVPCPISEQNFSKSVISTHPLLHLQAGDLENNHVVDPDKFQNSTLT